MKKATVYTETEALAHALYALEEGGIVSTPHLRHRMSERGFDMNDLIAVFENGHIKKPPKWDEIHQNWTYRVEGHDIEGDELSVVFAIDKNGLLHLITGI